MSTFIKILFFFGDLFFLNFSVVVAFYLGSDSHELSNLTYLLIFSNLTWLFLTTVSNPYNLNKGWSVSKILKSQIAFILIHLTVVASLVILFKRNYSVYQVGIIYVLFTPIFFGWKIFTYYLRKVFSPEVRTKNYILIGINSVSREIRRHYLQNFQLGYRFMGYFDAQDSKTLINNVRRFCQQHEVHEIFCCSRQLSDSSLKPLVDFGLDSLIKVRVVVDFEATRSERQLQLDRLEIEPGINVSLIPQDESRNQLIKRVFDILFSAGFLVLVMSWLLPILAIVIKLDSKGPVFFLQLRSGKDNVPFKCFKFRTMVVNQESDKTQATKNDSRITTLGHLLRRTSIDELPQFINVFIGNMSVVGPRPHMLKHTEDYSKLIEKFMGRHYVKPGITGLAQCLGYRGETRDLIDMENRVRMDRYYIENWTFWLDLKIIFLTVVGLMRGSEKAY